MSDRRAQDGQQTPPPPYTFLVEPIPELTTTTTGSTPVSVSMVSFATAPTSNHATSISSRPASAATDTSSLPLFSVHRRSQSGTSFVSSLTSMGRRSTSSATDSRSDAVSDFILHENHQRQQQPQQYQQFHQQFHQQFQQLHQRYPVPRLHARLPSAEADQAVCSDGRIGGAGARATTIASLLPDGIGPGIIELESESELDFESADEHPHILSESFVTNIPAASQFPATFGFRLTPYEPCEHIPSADRPFNFAQMLATLLAALPSHHADLRDSSPVRGPGNRNGGKVAFILISAQEASKANCKLSESVRRRREAAMASSLASARANDQVVIFHVHTIRGHADESSGNADRPVRNGVDARSDRVHRRGASRNRILESNLVPLRPEDELRSYRADTFGAKPLSWAIPLEGEYSLVKSGNSIFEGTSLEGLLKWRKCGTLLLSGFDTPSENATSWSRSDDRSPPAERVESVIFNTGGDLQHSCDHAFELDYTSTHIISEAHITAVSQSRQLLPSA